MRICPNCHAMLSEDVQICPNCGTSLGETPAAEPVLAAEQPAGAPVAPRKSPIGKILALVAAFLVLMVITLVLCLRPQPEAPRDDLEEEPPAEEQAGAELPPEEERELEAPQGDTAAAASEYDFDPLATELDLNEKDLHSLAGIEACTELETLLLYDNDIADLSPLAALPLLAAVDARYNDIEDLSPLANSTELYYLDLDGNEDLADLSPLYDLPELYYVSIYDTAVTAEEAANFMAAQPECFLDGNYKSTYLALRTGPTWSEAYDLCEANGAQLAVLDGEDDWDDAEDALEEAAEDGLELLWLGGLCYAGEEPYWLDGSMWDYAPWAEGQPATEDGGCVCLVRQNGAWRLALEPNETDVAPERVGFLMETITVSGQS